MNVYLYPNNTETSLKNVYIGEGNPFMDYQEVEYIYSNGNQRIDTGFVPNGNSRMYVDYQADTTMCSPIGCYNPNNSYGFLINGGNGTTVYTHYGTQNQGNSHDIRNRTVADLDKGVFKINNNTVRTYTLQTFDVGINAWLFCWNRDGTPSNNVGVKIWKAKIYNNGTLVRDFLPCYRKSDSVIGMYDTVNNQFYTNIGTGTFTKGPDVN